MIPLSADSYGLGRRHQALSCGTPGSPSILLATIDPEIGRSIGELLQTCTVNTLAAGGIEEIKAVLATVDVAACFCGFWLVDGTYRDVVRHLKRAEIPVIIVCAPTCPQEYRDYLAALQVRAFDFICYPYRRTDLQRILDSALAMRYKRHASEHSRSSSALAAPANADSGKARTQT